MYAVNNKQIKNILQMSIKVHKNIKLDVDTTKQVINEDNEVSALVSLKKTNRLSVSSIKELEEEYGFQGDTKNYIHSSRASPSNFPSTEVLLFDQALHESPAISPSPSNFTSTEVLLIDEGLHSMVLSPKSPEISPSPSNITLIKVSLIDQGVHSQPYSVAYSSEEFEPILASDVEKKQVQKRLSMVKVKLKKMSLKDDSGSSNEEVKVGKHVKKSRKLPKRPRSNTVPTKSSDGLPNVIPNPAAHSPHITKSSTVKTHTDHHTRNQSFSGLQHGHSGILGSANSLKKLHKKGSNSVGSSDGKKKQFITLKKF